MKPSPFPLLFLCTTITFAQETKKIKVSTKDPDCKEVFYVLKDKPDIKQGEYTKEWSGRGGLSERGQFENVRKVGVWKYFTAGKLEHEIDYSNNKILFTEPSFIQRSMIIEDGELRENNTGETPILLGGKGKFFYYFLRYMRYPAMARRLGVQGTVIVSATITKGGKLIDEQIEEGPANDLNEEALRVIRLLPDEWIPLNVKGVPIDSRVYIPVRFKLS